MTSMSPFTSGKSLRNKQRLLTEQGQCPITTRPPIGTTLRPLTSDHELIEKEASP